jgi:HAD superfamily, subfamily IIIB (Acid phosphatase)
MARVSSVLNRDSAAIATKTLAITRAFIATVLLVTAYAGSARAEPLAAACSKTYSPQTLDGSQPINLGQLKLQIYFYACAGGYDSDAAKVLADARAYVEKRAGEVANPALVLDIDETSLSNLPEMLANDIGYIPDGPCDRLPNGPCGFDTWVMSGKSKAIEGTLALFNAAKAHKVAVFFITGRHESPARREATIKNLKAAGYDGWAGLVLRSPSAGNMTIVGYKSGERAKIAAKHTIIANVGDQRSDLEGGYAERAYKLPNPFYFLP